MKHLFIKDDRYSEAATNIDMMSCMALKPIFDFWVKEGYSPREIAYTMCQAVNDISLDILLGFKGDEVEEETSG